MNNRKKIDLNKYTQSLWGLWNYDKNGTSMSSEFHKGKRKKATLERYVKKL